MRIAFAALLTLLAAPSVQAAAADPYQWCAEYGGSPGDATNCYFLTLQQCHAAIGGQNNAFCRRNLFYTGAPHEGPTRARRH